MSTSFEVISLQQRTLSKVKRYMFVYFFIGQILVQLDKANIGFAQLTMRKELALSATVFGLAAGIFSLASVIMQVPSAKLFEIFGARRWLTSIIALWGLTCMAQAFVTNDVELVILRFFLGIFEAGFFPSLIILLSIWFRGKQHGQAMGILQVGSSVAGIVSGPIAGMILGRVIFGLSGWRNLFLIEGGVTVIWAIVAVFIIYDGPNKAAWLKPEEREFMAKYLAEEQATKSPYALVEKANLWEALKDWRIVVLIISSACAGWVFMTFAYFSPTLLKMAGKGLDVKTVGFLSMGPYIIQAIVALTWGVHSDKHNERHWHLVGSLAVSAAGIVLYPVLSKQPLLAMLCLAMVQGGAAGFLVTFWPTANMTVGRMTIAKTTALIQAGSQLGGFLAPIVFGGLMDLSGGKTSLGLYEAVGVVLLNFVIMNVFFFNYKARLKKASVAAGLPTRNEETLSMR